MYSSSDPKCRKKESYESPTSALYKRLYFLSLIVHFEVDNVISFILDIYMTVAQYILYS